MKSNLNKARSAAFATTILACLSPQAASSDTITAPVFEQISPIPTTYNLGSDFAVLGLSAPGDVTAAVDAIPDQGSTSGCEAADFAGFLVGSIALVARGTCLFQDKVANAAAAGAVAVLISNNIAGPPGGTALDTTAIPALITSLSVGDEFRSLLTETGVIARVGVPVPGPIAGAGLPGLVAACVGLVALARRRRHLVG